MLSGARAFAKRMRKIVYIHAMDILSLDLNLLVVFDALLREKSVTRAADAVGLSQPATSAALGRLRTALADPLFVRAGQEMRPTPRALELADPVRVVIDTINGEILRLAAFDPASASRTFTIVTPDIGEVTFMPRIAAACARLAPGVNLASHSMPREQAGAALESGAADLALGFFPDLRRAGFFQQRLFRMQHVCLACAQRPLKGAQLTTREFLVARHVVVRPQGREHQFEQFLKSRRLERRVALEVAHFMSLTVILPGTDLIATVPQDIAEVIAAHAAIRILDMPLNPPTIEVQQFWHGRFSKDPANMWLRALVHGLFRR
jgi:DNA-binding transcriptional LysR family regulator